MRHKTSLSGGSDAGGEQDPSQTAAGATGTSTAGPTSSALALGTVPQSAINLGIFGVPDSTTGLFSSYDSGIQQGSAPVWYVFIVDVGVALADTFRFFEYVTGSYQLFDENMNPVSISDTTALDPGINYYLEVTPTQNSYHFGFDVAPNPSNVTNDAGHTAASPLALGTLSTVITHANDFYTYFQRQDISVNGPSTPGTLQPEFSDPLNEDQDDFYSFQLTSASPVTISAFSSGTNYLLNYNDTYILFTPGSSTSQIVNNGQTVQLNAGTYELEVVDSLTRATAGSNGITLVRNADTENYEHYQFGIYSGGGPSSLLAQIDSLSSSSVHPGDTITVNGSITAAYSVFSADYEIYLAPTFERTADGNSTVLATGSYPIGIAAGQTVNFSDVVTLPTLPSGFYHGAWDIEILPDYSYPTVGNAVASTITFVPAASDFYGSGTSDVLFRNTSGEVDTWLMNNGQMAGGSVVSTVSAAWRFVGVGDITGSGISDVLWQNTATGEVDSWLINDGNLSGGAAIGHASSVWQPLGTGNFNADGIADLLWRNTTTGEVDTWFMNNGQVSGGTAVGTVSGAWQFAGVGDFNGDGTSDVLWHNATTGEVDTWLINNGHISGGAAIGHASSVWQSLGTGDFNGDGISDILWRNTTTGEVDTWIMNNGRVTGGAALGSVSSAWQFAGIGYFTSAGTSDILWRNVNTGEVDTWLITNDRLTGGSAVSTASTAWQPQLIHTG
jgi:FG-GAP repeat